MKKLLFSALILIFSASLFSQNELNFFDQIILKQYDKSAQYFDTEINLCILDYEGLIRQREASQRMASFFEDNTPISYEISHHGKSRGGQSNYYVCNLKTKGGNLKVFFTKIDNSNYAEVWLEGEAKFVFEGKIKL